MLIKASDKIKIYNNVDGPTISTVGREVIIKDGKYYKNIDGSGKVNEINDWSLSSRDRAKSYVGKLTVEEKIGQLFISDWRMGKYPAPKSNRNPIDPKDIQLDESGTLDEGEFRGKTIFGEQHLPGTSTLIKEWFSRHLILRANPSPEDMTDYLNQLHSLAEEVEHFIPVQVASNSRNEHGEAVFGMNDAVGVFPSWPGTLGIAAAILGDGIEIADEFAEAVRRSWNGVGLRKGYMYMADVVTDPRWQRTFGTFGENEELVCEILEHIIPRIQGSEEGVIEDGIAMTIKHFPGGGARENGFDPHYKMGQWNVYQTEGSLQKYHLPPFKTAIKYNASSIMPYYAKPAKEKSKPQVDELGNEIPFDPYGFAYNKYFIEELLYKQMGFEGYVNSDTGIIHNMSWGVEALDIPERIAFAMNQGKVHLISGLFDNKYAKEALERSNNDYYEKHAIPEGFKKEDITLSMDKIDDAVIHTLTEMFSLGMFEDTYREVEKAKKDADNGWDWNNALMAHRKSVTVLKNKGILPLTSDVMNNKRIYAQAFAKTKDKAEEGTKILRKLLKDNKMPLTDSVEEADYAILILSPVSGEYFNATPGYLELDICENKEVFNVDDRGVKTKETHLETTLFEVEKIKEIADIIHSKGGKVIMNVNVTLAWQLGNIEPYADALLVGYDTYLCATLDVIVGEHTAMGKLPLTLPKGDEVLAVDEKGVCISPNDVPGYDKDKYMPQEMKDENGKAYAYRDSEGNYYEYGFGLSF